MKTNERPFRLRFWQAWTQLSSPAEGMVSRTHTHEKDEDDEDDYWWQAHALYSNDEKYRYALAKIWNPEKVPLCALMLNPSTATELVLDPTVQRIQSRARGFSGGEPFYGGFLILNAFALRSTDPRALYAHRDPIGRENDRVIDTLAPLAGVVLCGWGNHGEHLDRGLLVRERLKNLGITPYTLGLTKTKQPTHPLYQSYERKMQPWI